MELGYWPSDVNYWDPDSLICIPVSKAKDSRFHKNKTWILDSTGKNFTDSGFPYMGRSYSNIKIFAIIDSVYSGVLPTILFTRPCKDSFSIFKG